MFQASPGALQWRATAARAQTQLWHRIAPLQVLQGPARALPRRARARGACQQLTPRIPKASGAPRGELGARGLPLVASERRRVELTSRERLRGTESIRHTSLASARLMQVPLKSLLKSGLKRSFGPFSQRLLEQLCCKSRPFRSCTVCVMQIGPRGSWQPI